MKRVKSLFFGGMLFASAGIQAQDSTSSESKLNLTGSIDTYFRTTLNTSDNIGGASIAPGTSFANQTGFAMGMANIILEKSIDNSGFVADLVFGPRGADAVFNDVAPLNIVNQIFAYWNASEKLTLSAGNFNTFLGYEVISPTANFNYSTSYMFSYGPFSHMGIKADYAITEKISAMVGLLNPTDFTSSINVSNLSLGVQLGYSDDETGIFLNYLGGNQTLVDGSDPMHQIDLTATRTIGDFSLGINATINTITESAPDDSQIDTSRSFSGVAAYLQYMFSESFSLGFRGEYFSVVKGYIDPGISLDSMGDGSVIDLTLSANYKIGALTLIPEFRIDVFDDNIIPTKDFDVSDTKFTDQLMSFTLAAVYAF